MREGSLYEPCFPDDWPRHPLFSLAQWVNGIAFRDIYFSATGRPVIKIAEVKNGITQQTKFTQQVFDDNVLIREGDLIFSWSGQPETSIDAFWWRGSEGWLNQHLFHVIPKPAVDKNFLFYLLRYLRPTFVRLARNKQTTGLGHVTRRDMEALFVGVPPTCEQRAIAHVLGALDDKIEANARQARLISELAGAAWRYYAKGMRAVPLGEVVEVGLSGVWGHDSASGPASVEVMCLRGRDIEDLVAQRIAAAPRRWLTPKQLLSRSGNKPEIWTAGSGSLGPTLLVTDRLRGAFGMPIVYSNFVKRLVPRPGMHVHLPSAWFALLRAWGDGDLSAVTTGTAMPNLDVAALLALTPVPLLEGDALVEVAELADLALDPRCAIENQRLAALRDALLPKLLSGELRVRDAESLVGEAV